MSCTDILLAGDVEVDDLEQAVALLCDHGRDATDGGFGDRWNGGGEWVSRSNDG